VTSGGSTTCSISEIMMEGPADKNKVGSAFDGQDDYSETPYTRNRGNFMVTL